MSVLTWAWIRTKKVRKTTKLLSQILINCVSSRHNAIKIRKMIERGEAMHLDFPKILARDELGGYNLSS